MVTRTRACSRRIVESRISRDPAGSVFFFFFVRRQNRDLFAELCTRSVAGKKWFSVLIRLRRERTPRVRIRSRTSHTRTLEFTVCVKELAKKPRYSGHARLKNANTQDLRRIVTVSWVSALSSISGCWRWQLRESQFRKYKKRMQRLYELIRRHENPFSRFQRRSVRIILTTENFQFFPSERQPKKPFPKIMTPNILPPVWCISSNAHRRHRREVGISSEYFHGYLLL